MSKGSSRIHRLVIGLILFRGARTGGRLLYSPVPPPGSRARALYGSVRIARERQLAGLPRLAMANTVGCVFWVTLLSPQ